MLEIGFGIGLIILVGLCFIEVYRLGFSDGQRASEGKEIDENKNKPIFSRPKTRAEKIRDKKTDALLENINNYNGSGLGQKDIK